MAGLPTEPQAATAGLPINGRLAVIAAARSGDLRRTGISAADAKRGLVAARRREAETLITQSDDDYITGVFVSGNLCTKAEENKDVEDGG